MISCRKWKVYLIRQKRCLAWPCQAIEVNCDVRRMKRDIIIKPNFRYRTDMRLSSLCRDRFNQIKPLSQSRVIWNLNFKSHTWTHFCFKVQTRSAQLKPNPTKAFWEFMNTDFPVRCRPCPISHSIERCLQDLFSCTDVVRSDEKLNGV